MSAVQFWKPHALSKPHDDQLDLRIGDRVQATVDLVDVRGGRDVPSGTVGRVILANGFNWQRYRVLFDNGHLEPIGRAAKRLAKQAKLAAR